MVYDSLLCGAHVVILTAGLADCRETLVAIDAVDAEVALLLRPIKQVIVFEQLIVYVLNFHELKL